MTHLYTVILPYAELREKFQSDNVKEYLQRCARKTKGDQPFLYIWVSNEDPLENLAVAWMFPNHDVAWVELLVMDDGTQYIPIMPEPDGGMM